MNIPADFISLAQDNEVSRMSIELVFSKIKWHDERTIRYLNSSNLDCLFELASTDPDDKDMNARYLKLLSIVKIDNQHENIKKPDSKHFFWERKDLEQRDVLERLIRMNQDYKSSLQHALNTGDKNF